MGILTVTGQVGLGSAEMIPEQRVASPARRLLARAAAATAVVLVLAGCAQDAKPAVTVSLPPAGAVADYQLGGAYPLPQGATVVARDSTDEPAAGAYSICYLNGFQSQPAETSSWIADRPDLVLRDEAGPVIDANWPDEIVFDTSTEAKQAGILEVIGPLIDGCAAAGFDAVEFDNLDSFTRTGGLLTASDNFALASSYVDRAHAVGLAAAQKNTAEHARLLHEESGFDFAVVEECWRFEECGLYTAVYGDRVIDIEYVDDLRADFAETCADPEAAGTTILRDRDLVRAGEPGYTFAHC